jgi:glycosyltransferase involved in cell wall biosynthesis
MPAYWPAFEQGGPVFSVHWLNRELLKKKDEVTVYTVNLDKEKNSGYQMDRTIDGVKVKYFSKLGLFDLAASKGWQFSFDFWNEIKRTIRNFDLVYVVSVWGFPTLAAMYYSSKNKVPFVLSPRGQIENYSINIKGWKKKPYWNLVLKTLANKASAIHYTTENEAKSHKHSGLAVPYFIVPNGIKPEDFFKKPKNSIEKKGKKEKKILFFGTIRKEKGIDNLLDAFLLVSKKSKEYRLVLAGPCSKEYKKELVSKIKNKKIPYSDKEKKITAKSSLVEFTGLVSGKEKKQLLSSSSVFVLPSESESFGLAIVEAMASGTPIIISNKVGIAEQVKKRKAGIITNNSPEDIARGIALVCDNMEFRKEITKNAIALVKQEYNTKKTAALIKKEFSMIVKKFETNKKS